MKKITLVFLFIVLSALSVSAQPETLQDPLLEHMIGKWILQGTMAGRETTHDIDVEWILGHRYVQLHEVAREKKASGEAAYEATVFLGWDPPSSQYACLWLDVTGIGGLSAQAIGHAPKSTDKMAFLFKYDCGIFHTTFVYDEHTDTWQWLMDEEEKGKLQPFARVKMTRRG